MMKHLEQDELALHYFGDDAPAAHAQAEAHLKQCAACRADFEAMSQTLATVREAQPPVPERPAGYEEQVWNSIRAHLPERESKTAWWAWITQPRQWAIAGAMAVIIVGAFLAGRFTKSPEQPGVQVARNQGAPSVTPNVQGPQPQVPTNPNPNPQPDGSRGSGSVRAPRGSTETEAGAVPVNVPAQRERTRDRILLVAVGDHLEKSQMVLMELVNAAPEKGDKGEVDIASEQERAEDLLSSNRLYRMTAQEIGDKKMANVLDELERVLIEIAHEPAKVNSDELKDLQRRIEAQGVLFKVRVVGANIRDQKKPEPQSKPKARTGVTEKRQSI
jgi:hypothetical protein